MTLARFEWKKGMGRRAIVLAIVILTVVDLANISYRVRSDSWFYDSPGWQKAYWQLYGELSGTITQEKLDRLESLYAPLAEKVADLTFSRADDPDSLTGINAYSDYLMLERFYVEPMQRFLAYRDQAQQIARYALDEIRLYRQLGDPYGCRKNEAIYALFAHREITSFAYTEIWERLADDTFSVWPTLLVCLFAASASFSSEKETEMELLIGTMPNGRKRTAIAKCLAYSAFAVLVALWTSLCDLIGFAWSYQTVAGWSMPIYALADYANTPLRCSVGAYFLICAGLRALGALFFTLLGCAFSSLFSNALYPFMAGSAVAFTSCAVAVASRSWHSPCWRAFDPAALLFPKNLFATTEHLELLGRPILAPVLTVACTASATVLILVFLCRKGERWRSFSTSGKRR